MATAVLSLSVVLQCVAAWLAFRLRRETANRSWYLICIAVGLMALRRSITLVRILSGASHAILDPWAETVALVISILMVAGLALIRPLFRSMSEATARIRRSEEYFRHLIESAEDIITVLDEEGTILYESPAAQRLLGYDADRVGVSMFQTMHPQDRAHAAQQLKEAFAAPGEQQELTIHARAADGSVHTLECTGRVHADPDGRLVGIVNSRDVTTRLAIQADAARLGQILQRSLNEIYLFDPSTLRFQFANDGALDNLGYRLDEFQALTPSDIKPEYTYDRFERLLTPLRSGARKTVTVRTRHRRRDGSEYPVEVHLQLMHGEGDPIFAAIILDLTEREQAEAERRSLEQQLRRAQRLESIGTLASGVAHDFNNILTPILGHLDLAMPRVTGDEDTTRSLERATQAALRARDLVRRLLTFSREVEQERVPVSLEQVVAETIALLRSSLPATVEISLAAQTDEPYSVLGDATQLHQVVLNLCTNAAHAMREEGGLLQVSLALCDELPALPEPQPAVQRPGPFVHLRVRDTGTGMDTRTVERIFEPFFTTKGVTEGSGLGLAVVYGIVNAHGGSIAIDTAPARGTTFSVYLPRILEDAAADTDPTASLPMGTGHVLFVDDEESIAELAQELLQSLGYEVTVCPDGPTALDTVRAAPNGFDAVVTDETMPGMRGTQLSSELLTLRPGLPILLATGYSAGVTRASVRRIGIRGLLRKPYGRRELAEALDEVIREGHPSAG